MAAVPPFLGLHGLLNAVFDAQFFARRYRVAASNAKTGFDPAQLPFTLPRDFQRRKFVLNKLPAVGSLSSHTLVKSFHPCSFRELFLASSPSRLSNLVSVLVSFADALTSKPLLHAQLGMEPMAGIEPATDGLRNRCSTTELHWLTTI